MKSSFLQIVALSLFLVSPLFSSEIVKKDGEIVQGEILEFLNGESVRIRTKKNKEFLFYWDEIKAIDSKRLGRNSFSDDDETDLFMDQTWFMYWGLGAGWVEYTNEALAILPSERKNTASIDVLGFYWPLCNRRTLIGFVVNGFTDVWLQGPKEIQVVHTLLALSTWYSLKGEMGDGAFIRVDMGPQFIDYNQNKTIGPFNQNPEFGMSLGIGTFFGSHPERRYLVTAMVTPRFNRREVLTRTSLKFGLLW